MNGKNPISIVTVPLEQLRQIIKEEISLIQIPEQTQTDPTNKKEFLTTEQVMELLSCSRSSIRNYINNGKLKPIYFGDRRYFNLKDIEKEMVRV